jgi:hypothetical protein
VKPNHGARYVAAQRGAFLRPKEKPALSCAMAFAILRAALSIQDAVVGKRRRDSS